MAIDMEFEQQFWSHLNMTFAEVDETGHQFLNGLLVAAVAHTEAQLGYRIDDTTEFPDGLPADVRQAILMLAAHWFANRETAIVGVTMMPVPFGFDDVIRSHRRLTFG